MYTWSRALAGSARFNDRSTAVIYVQSSFCNPARREFEFQNGKRVTSDTLICANNKRIDLIWSDLLMRFSLESKKEAAFWPLALDLSVVFVSNGICPEMWIIVVHLDLNTVNNFFGGGGGGGNVHRLWHNWEEVSSQWRGMDASLAQSSKWNMTRVWTSSLLLCAPFCRYR